MLAKIHIAKKDMNLPEDAYRAILSGFIVARGERKGQPAESAAELTMLQLENCVKYMEFLGWQPRRKTRKRAPAANRIIALQDRARQLAAELDNGPARLTALLKKETGLDSLEWLRDTQRLKRILAILETFKRQESGVGGQRSEVRDHAKE